MIKREAFTVVLQSSPDDTGLQHGSGSAVLLRYAADGTITSELSPSSRLPTAWKQLLIEPRDSAYYITDGMSPDVSLLDPQKVHIIEVSSPLEKRWKYFTSGLAAGRVETHYMPLVPLAEMQHMRAHVGPGSEPLEAGEVRSRYEKLGGSVRGVLVRARVPADTIIGAALAHATSLDAVLASSTTSGELEGSGIAHIPSTLVHFRVSEEPEAVEPLVDGEGNIAQTPLIVSPFSSYEAIFASNYIRRQILVKFRSRFIAMLGEMVRTADLPYTSVLQGNLYEEFVHERIQAAVANPCVMRSLESTAAPGTSVDLSGHPCVEFADATELASIALQEGQYYKPISRSFGAVDFVLGSRTVGNMTLNLRHGISITALLRVVRAMGFTAVEEPPVLRFFWLLPTRSLFQRMKKQPLSYAGRVIPAPAEAGAAAGPGQLKYQELEQLVRLQQFAVCMPPVEEEAEERGTAMLEGEEEEEEEAQVEAEEAEDEHAEIAAAAASAQSSVSSRGLRKRKSASTQSASRVGESGSARKRGGDRGGAGGGAGTLSIGRG